MCAMTGRKGREQPKVKHGPHHAIRGRLDEERRGLSRDDGIIYRASRSRTEMVMEECRVEDEEDEALK